MADLSVDLLGTRIKNPVIPASGTFGYGYEYALLYDINMLGAFSFKGTTLGPRFGNPTPRIAETASGMLNSVGLQNPGAEKVISEELPKLSKVYSGKVLANLSGFSVDEYVALCEIFNDSDQIGWYEINISCPNVKSGAMSFGVTCESAAQVTKAVKKVSKKPVIIKLTPNVTDISQIAKACEDNGADAICLINTLMGMRIDITKRRPLLANITGGLSGNAVFPVALKMVNDVYKAVKIPVIGVGGISSAEDVVEMMLAGATAVEVGTANLSNPYACKKIIENLSKTCESLSIDKISDITGGICQ